MSGKPARKPVDQASDKPRVVDFKCADCDEALRGLEGQIAKCPACGHMQDAPYADERA